MSEILFDLQSVSLGLDKRQELLIRWGGKDVLVSQNTSLRDMKTVFAGELSDGSATIEGKNLVFNKGRASLEFEFDFQLAHVHLKQDR